MEGFYFTETAGAGILMPALQYVNQYRERRRRIFQTLFWGGAWISKTKSIDNSCPSIMTP